MNDRNIFLRTLIIVLVLQIQVQAEELIVCEGDRANISCPEGQFITIRYANYGRFTINQCNPTYKTDISTTCQNDKTLPILQLSCDQKRECLIDVETKRFGPDPCPGISKYLETVYSCTIKEVLLASTAVASSSITIHSNSTDFIKPTSLSSSSLILSSSTPLTTFLSIISNSEFENTVELNEFCNSTERRGIDWPRTSINHIAKVACPIGARGIAQWNCMNNSKWDYDGPDLSLCSNTWSKDLLLDAEEAKDSSDYLEILREIQQFTKKESLLGGDLITLISAINLSIPTKMESKSAQSFIELVAESANNMMKKSQMPAWLDLKRKKCLSAANALMNDINRVTVIASDQIISDQSLTVIKPNIVLEVSNIRISEYVTFPSMSLYQSSYDTVQLPREALAFQNPSNTYSKVLYAAYSTLGAHLEPKPKMNEKGINVMRTVASKILSTSIIGANSTIQMIKDLQKPIIITFSIKDWANISSPTCVWWNSSNLEWSSSGCNLYMHNTTHTICHCYHLTHFAILMDIYNQQLSVEHEIALTFITYFGCSISILCLILSFIAFICFGTSAGDRVFIHKNLCFSLTVAELVFLFGIFQTDNRLICGIFAVILHYFFLVSFSWMLLEGFELYYMLVEVFQSKYSRKPYLVLFGYGFPMLIVSVALFFDPYSYGTKEYCWLRSDNYFILWFVVPVALTLLFNFIFLAMTLRIVHKHSSKGYISCRQDPTALKNIRNWLKGSLALIVLLGLTWVLGFIWLDKQSVVVAYAFTILNSLQGLFIFLFHVIFNDRMHKDYHKWVKHSSLFSTCFAEESSNSRAVPYNYQSTSRTTPGAGTNSSAGSEPLYPPMNDYYSQRLVSVLDSRRNNSVRTMVTRNRFAQNGVYDYATISYDDLGTGSPVIFPNNFHHHQRQSFDFMPAMVPQSVPSYPYFVPPPKFPPPPPPMSSFINSARPSSAATTKLSDDSAYSGSSSTFPYFSDLLSSSGLLLRMDPSKTPPIYLQNS